MSDEHFAESFFADRTLDLADLSHLNLAANQLLDLSLQMNVDAHGPGNGFGFSFLLGNASFISGGPTPVPAPPPLLMFGAGLGMLGALGCRARTHNRRTGL